VRFELDFTCGVDDLDAIYTRTSCGKEESFVTVGPFFSLQGEMDAAVWGSGKVQRKGRMFDVHNVRESMNNLEIAGQMVQRTQSWHAAQSQLLAANSSGDLSNLFTNKAKLRSCVSESFGAGSEPCAPEEEPYPPRQPGTIDGGASSTWAAAKPHGFVVGSSTSSAFPGGWGQPTPQWGLGQPGSEAASQRSTPAATPANMWGLPSYPGVFEASNSCLSLDSDEIPAPAMGTFEDAEDQNEGAAENVRRTSQFGGTMMRRKSSFGADLQTQEALAMIQRAQAEAAAREVEANSMDQDAMES
jgi:hypothetical protein